LAKTFQIQPVLIMSTEWLSQLCKNNGFSKSIKITVPQKVIFVRKSMFLNQSYQPRFANPQNCLNISLTFNRRTSYPNLFVALRIYMTVTVASEKGVFLSSD